MTRFIRRFIRQVSTHCALAFATVLVSSQGAVAEQMTEVRASFQNVRLVGFTRPKATIELISEEQGKFNTVNVDVGDTIAKSQPFGCMDSTYVDLKIKANKAQQKRLQADLTYYGKQVTRFTDLVDRNTSAKSELDDFERKKAGTDAELEEAKVAHKELQEHKRRHCIQAREGWRVTSRLVDPDQWVNVGSPVGSIADFSALLVPFALSYQEYQAVSQSPDQLMVTLLDLDNKIDASAVHINPDFNETTRKLSLDLLIDKGIKDMRGGLRVELELQVPDPSGAKLVPMAALEQRYEQYWVSLGNGSELAVVYLGSVVVDGKKWGRVVSPELTIGDKVIVGK